MKATEQELTNIANALCEKYGYEPVEVTYNPRLRRVIANCDYAKHHISVATKYVLENNKWFLIRVLKHEIAHLKYHTHDKAFEKACNRMGIIGGPCIQKPFRSPNNNWEVYK